MSVEAAILALRTDPRFLSHVTTWRRLPERAARTEAIPAQMDPRLQVALRRRGIERLYTHQVAAWQAARQGRHVVVVTPTASGKSLCYHLPVLHDLLGDPQARALYLFPTKALAQDQLAELEGMGEGISESGNQRIRESARGRGAGSKSQIANRRWQIADGEWRMANGEWESADGEWRMANGEWLGGIRPATYDGDTPQRDRGRIRRDARVLLTNPDMLHMGILPHHPRWADFFGHLRYVVIDEVHAYRGVFGSHFANVLRRLRRICRFYGSQPQFLCASATIANPGQLAEQLLEAPVTLIDDDGSPQGERHVVFYNPPIVNPELGLRRSSLLEAENIAAGLVARGVQTIVFARSRLTMEVLLTYLRERVGEFANQRIGESAKERMGARQQAYREVGSQDSIVRGYRGGYLPDQRREIEQGLRRGAVRAVVATNALELGVNIGGLDAAVLTGFPGTIASTWQQAGRAGRRGKVSLAILVATPSALDQYVIGHPEYFFQRSPEHARISPNNLVILSNHMACAAFELPFKDGERFGDVLFTDEVLAYLAEIGEVQQHGGDWFWMGQDYPAQGISLRTASPDNVVIQAAVDQDEARRVQVIGELEREAAPYLLFPGAVYLHEGQFYLVEELDWQAGQALVVPAPVDYYTQAQVTQQVFVLGINEEVSDERLTRAYGPVQIRSQANLFRKVKLYTHETLGHGKIDLPEQVLETDAYWIALGEALLNPLREAGQWRSDLNEYGPDWKQQRQAARARDGFRCTVCGRPEQGGRQHDVHHKVPFRTYGYVPGLNDNYRLANRLENLTTLCRPCHLRVEQGQRLRSGLNGLGYVLANIAPLHLMCDPKDIGVVSEMAGTRAGEKEPQTRPTITIFEKVPAGIGFSQQLFELHETLLRAAETLVRRCPCLVGCPACVGPLFEDQQQEIDAKALTLALIEACLLGG